MSRPTQRQLAEWRALCEKATEGPWKSLRGGLYPNHVGGPGKIGNAAVFVAQTATNVGGEADADFIAAAREAMPALIEEVERLRGHFRQVRAATCGSGQASAIHDVDHVRSIVREALNE